MEKTRITLIEYDESHIQEKEVKSVEECFPLKDKPAVTWINIDGIHQVDIMEKRENQNWKFIFQVSAIN